MLKGDEAMEQFIEVDPRQVFDTEMSDLRAIEPKAWREKSFRDRIKSIELFMEQVNAIRMEFERRGLKNMSTDMLYENLMKLITLLKLDESPMKLQKQPNWDNIEIWP